MKLFSRSLCLALALAFVAVPMAFGQGVTTSAIGGIVTDQDGGALPGALVTAVYEPTGTTYTAVTSATGRFNMQNTRVGGPYSVTAELDGFRPQQTEGVFTQLGEKVDLAFTLQLDSIEETVVVVGESTPLINSSKTGNTSNVYTEVINSLPSISRGLEDFARTNPFFNVNPDNDEEAQVTVAGRNNRYNNITIDGAVNNDLFGLGASGTPGGQTETTPISLDAIQEIQLLVAPFDVRQGGFSGGGINAITRSGTNDFKGSVFYFTRDEGLVGDGPDDREFGTFEEEQYGFRLGGKIIEDKAFFFVNGEVNAIDEPSGFTISGGPGQPFGFEAEAQRFAQIAQTQYGFDVGALDEQTLSQESDKFFARFDFNLNDSNNLLVRFNYVDALKDFLRPESDAYEFPSHGHVIESETSSLVAQLNSVLGSDRFNEARISYQDVADQRRSAAQPFPYINVEVGDVEFEAGTERFSTANALDQELIEIHNDFTWIVGDHTITIGTHNELFSFSNLFIRENFGSYQFENLDAFEAGIAFQYDHSFSQTSDPLQRADFDVESWSAYVGDQWAVRDNLTLTLGVRVDLPRFPDDPNRNPASEATFGFRTDVTASNDLVFSPRLGFNWDPANNGKSQVRGGVGIFAGRAPFVWISNQYSNTGIEFGRLRVQGEIPFNPDPFNQPTQVGDLFTNEINLIDPDFQMPTIWRANLAYDRELGFWGMTGSAEVIYSEVIEDITYQNLNLRDTGTTVPFDGRPVFETLDRSFADVIFLTNTDEGDQTSLALKLERPLRDGIYGYVSYVYSDSSVVNDGTSSQARSNWRFMETTGDPNNLSASTSDFEVEDRISAALSYRLEWNDRWATTFGLFYNAQSGRPYSTTYGFNFPDFASINGDGQSNDLIYVPAGPGDVEIVNGTWEDLDRYISLDSGLDGARGGIVDRNASTAPWTHTLDLQISQEIPVPNSKLEITLDILNLANLFDSDSGVNRFVNFSGVSPIEYEGTTDDGRPIYFLEDVVFNPEERFETDDLRSRWRAKLGVRWSF
ncbi:MAG: TonB-dependent receptor [Acidobacteriota bacterium]